MMIMRVVVIVAVKVKVKILVVMMVKKELAVVLKTMMKATCISAQPRCWGKVTNCRECPSILFRGSTRLLDNGWFFT